MMKFGRALRLAAALSVVVVAGCTSAPSASVGSGPSATGAPASSDPGRSSTTPATAGTTSVAPTDAPAGSVVETAQVCELVISMIDESEEIGPRAELELLEALGPVAPPEVGPDVDALRRAAREQAGPPERSDEEYRAEIGDARAQELVRANVRFNDWLEPWLEQSCRDQLLDHLDPDGTRRTSTTSPPTGGRFEPVENGIS